jgi:probable addiction module antidote protein
MDPDASPLNRGIRHLVERAAAAAGPSNSRKENDRMALETVPWDAAEFLGDEETIAAYLTEALKSDDPRIIAKALGAVARAKGGMAQLARDTGIAREALYRALGDSGNPELGTALKVMHALGVRLTASMVA